MKLRTYLRLKERLRPHRAFVFQLTDDPKGRTDVTVSLAVAMAEKIAPDNAPKVEAAIVRLAYELREILGGDA